MLNGLGAATRTINEPFSARSLKDLDVLIVADPDTPKEAASPNLITDAEIDAAAAWVHEGGTLLLLNNDPGNSEFPRMNALAKRFGIEFEERKHADTAGNSKLTLTTPQGGWFTPGLKFYGVDLAPLRITAQSADTLLAERDTVMMTASKVGKGQVIALGDPWLYNEYLYTQDNRRIAEELFRKILR
jgi:unsaturated rhamnogalacturonyl hydrolase